VDVIRTPNVERNNRLFFPPGPCSLRKVEKDFSVGSASADPSRMEELRDVGLSFIVVGSNEAKLKLYQPG